MEEKLETDVKDVVIEPRKPPEYKSHDEIRKDIFELHSSINDVVKGILEKTEPYHRYSVKQAITHALKKSVRKLG